MKKVVKTLVAKIRVNKRLDNLQKQVEEMNDAHYKTDKKILEAMESLSEAMVMNRNDINNLAREISGTQSSKKSSKKSSSKKGAGVMYG
jgi:hypothetical protein